MWPDALTSRRRRSGASRQVEDEHTPDAIRTRLAQGLVAFVTVGFVPLGPFVVDALVGGGAPFAWSAGLTVAAFFAVGAGKGLVVAQAWWRSGMEMVVVGGTAAALAYAVGVVLGGIG